MTFYLSFKMTSALTLTMLEKEKLDPREPAALFPEQDLISEQAQLIHKTQAALRIA